MAGSGSSRLPPGLRPQGTTAMPLRLYGCTQQCWDPSSIAGPPAPSPLRAAAAAAARPPPLAAAPIDDSMAILAAFNSPELQVLGLTSIYGNVPTPMATRNALTLCHLAGRPEVRGRGGRRAPSLSCHAAQIGSCCMLHLCPPPHAPPPPPLPWQVPVVEGSHTSLRGAAKERIADFVHGSDGFGNTHPKLAEVPACCCVNGEQHRGGAASRRQGRGVQHPAHPRRRAHAAPPPSPPPPRPTPRPAPPPSSSCAWRRSTPARWWCLRWLR